jgi:hypothetical protein
MHSSKIPFQLLGESQLQSRWQSARKLIEMKGLVVPWMGSEETLPGRVAQKHPSRMQARGRFYKKMADYIA